MAAVQASGGDAQRAFVLDQAAVTRAWIEEKLALGELTQAQADKLLKDVESGGKFAIPTIKDLAGSGKLAWRLAKDMKSWKGRVYFKRYGGADYVIVKGLPGQRQILTGTRYKTTNTKIIELQIGRPGLRAAAKESMMFGIVIVAAIDITDFIVRDSATLGELFGTLGMDIGKVLISSMAGMAVGSLAVGTAVIGTFAIGPLVVACLVGIAVGIALDKLDEHFGITERLSRALDDGLAKMERLYRQLGGMANRAIVEIERSRFLLDLSREVQEIMRRLGRYNDPMRWQFVPY